MAGLVSPEYPSQIEVPRELRTERLTLRPVRDRDAEEIFSAIEESREQLAPWLIWPAKMRSVIDVRDLCARSAAKWLLRTDLMFGVFRSEDERFLGATGLHQPNWSLRSFEIGYWLRSSAVGQGYVTEAVSVLVRMAFNDLQARRVEIRCDPANERSRRVPERLGFVLEGRLRSAALTPDGIPRDTLVFSIVAGDLPDLPE
ncbi:MAG: GNAT family N-acetyltransferase [Thermomicrobiales bacterium]|nr:GNAT family N-acetyltransferase [Thermomicrobiales bacterium]